MRIKVDQNGNWRSFRHRNFRILYPANAMTNIGTWAQRVAQDWLVLELTHNNGTYLGLVTAIQFAPVLLFSLHGGALADRVDKRKLLIWTNIVAAIACYTLGILVVTHHIKLWHVFAMAALLGISSALDAPIRQSFTAEIVGHSDVANAVFEAILFKIARHENTDLESLNRAVMHAVLVLRVRPFMVECLQRARQFGVHSHCGEWILAVHCSTVGRAFRCRQSDVGCKRRQANGLHPLLVGSHGGNCQSVQGAQVCLAFRCR